MRFTDPDVVLRRYPHQLERRHAAARRDRDGAGDRSRSADHGRTDDRARRHRRGGGARPRRRAAPGVPLGDPADQPQPRGHRPRLRSRRRDVRRSHGRGGPDAGGAARRPPSLHGRAAALHPARGSPQGRRTARHDRRQSAASGREADRMRVRRPLRDRRAGLPRSGACAARGAGRPPDPLPFPRARAVDPACGRWAGRAAHGRCTRRDAAGADRRCEQDLPLARARDRRADWRRPRALGRRDARPRGGVGVGQDHARAHPAGTRGVDERQGRARRQAPRRADRRSQPRSGPRRADRVPEPGLGAQPAPHRAPDHAARSAPARRDEGQGRQRPRARPGRIGAPARDLARRARPASSPAARSSASRSRVRSPGRPSWWCATSRPRRSTCRCRRRS